MLMIDVTIVPIIIEILLLLYIRQLLDIPHKLICACNSYLQVTHFRHLNTENVETQ